MVVQLKRRTGKLLRTVNGKPHASSDDHDEADMPPPSSQQVVQTEEEIHAEPISSDDERRGEPTHAKDVPSTKPADAPKRKTSTRKPSIRVPRTGMYANVQADKARRSEEEKENKKLSPTSSAGKRALEEDEGERPPFDSFEYARPSKMSKTIHKSKSTPNIHTGNKPTYGRPATYGSRKLPVKTESPEKEENSLAALMKYSDRRPKSADDNKDGVLPTPPPRPTYGNDKDSDSDVSTISVKLKRPPKKQSPKKLSNDKDADADVSTVSLPRPPKKPSPKKPTPRKSKTPKKQTVKKQDCSLPRPASSPAAPRPTNLLDTLGAYAKPQPSPRSLEPINLDPNTSGNSSPLSSLSGSIADPSELQQLEQYAAGIVKTADDAECPLCQKPVEPTHFHEFWDTKPRSIHYQRIFCREHIKRSALKEYKSKGYPEINWTALPSRVRRYHMELKAIITSSKPSTFRTTQESSSSSLRSSRNTNTRQKGLDTMERNADLLAQTGYYGSRGSRAMMEITISQLNSVLREYESKDALIVEVGVANFVLRVLVPELTIRLVMEDMECSEGMAREVIEESGELGGVVNEDLGDDLGEQAV